MTRIYAIALTLVVVLGCNKPSEERCRAALSNMRGLMGTDSSAASNTGGDIEGALRRCKGGSTKEAVECAANAKTIEDLEGCQFMHIPDKNEACKKALAKVKALRGTEGPKDAERCKTYARKIIQCAAEAANAEEVDKCGFLTKEGSGS
jgi:hypothetical protein